MKTQERPVNLSLRQSAEGVNDGNMHAVEWPGGPAALPGRPGHPVNSPYFPAEHIHAAADEEVVLVAPAIHSAGFLRRQNREVAETGLAKPRFELGERVVMLIVRRVPVERVTQSVLPALMRTEIDDLVEQ